MNFVLKTRPNRWLLALGLIATLSGINASASMPLAPAPELDSASLREDVIYNGRPVEEADAEWRTTVFLDIIEKSDGWEYMEMCTGTLLSDRVVLTAAHCVVNAQTTTVKFVKGTNWFFGQKGEVDKVLIHPLYDHSKKTGYFPNYDVAVIRFKGKLPDTHHKAELLTDLSKLRVGTEVTMAGFGRAEDRGYGRLRVTRSRIFERPSPMDAILYDPVLNGSGCKGDSGGPAFIRVDGKLLVWGIASWISKGREPHYCDDGQHVVYLAATAYLDWIEQAKRQLESN